MDMKQVARELGVRYVVEGSVRRSGDRVRVTAQLVDAETANHIWAERYDRDVNEVFAVQDEITTAVVTAILPAVADAEMQRVLRKPPENLGAWEAYQRGLWHASKERVIDNALARGSSSRRYASIRHLRRPKPSWHGPIMPMDRPTLRDHTGPQCSLRYNRPNWPSRSILLMPRRTQRLAQHISIWETSHLRPSTSSKHWQLTRTVLGRARGKAAPFLWRGHPAKGRDVLLAALRLNPRGETAARVRAQIAMSYYLEGDYVSAVDAAKQASRGPSRPSVGLSLAGGFVGTAWPDRGGAALPCTRPSRSHPNHSSSS